MASYWVSGIASGTWSMIVEAETEAEAKDKASAIVDADDYVPDLEDLTDLSIDGAVKMEPIRQRSKGD